MPSPARMNENSPICARLAATVSAVASGRPNASTMAKAATDLPTTITSSTISDRQRLAHQDRRIEQHADRDEEQHGERVLERQGIGGGAGG